MKKILVIAIFFCLHLYFLIATLIHQKEFLLITITLSLIILLKFLSYLHIIKTIEHKWGTFPEFISVVLGAVSTFYLNNNLMWGPVISSAFIGVIGGLTPFINPKSKTLKEASPAIYCGTFIGMASTIILENIYIVLLAGICSGILYVVSKNLFIGFGGKLGSIAFGGVVSVIIITTLFSW